jgi:hypothetical protein
MKANIPMANSVSKKELAAFKAKRDALNGMLKQQEIKLAQQSEKDSTS